ncbi:MAG: hypothetical protein IKZ62_05985 [Prevotella sp.]|nr:hypothetical protein [Prevotella sp.]
MKKGLLLVVICLMAGTTFSYAQLTNEQIKERKELKKASKKELSEKATKTSRKEAKKLAKEGWKVAPGALPMEKQLDRSYLMQLEYDDDMFQKYIVGDAMSFGSVYDAAKLQATELAKQNLAGQIQTEITALIENTVVNEQIGKDTANSLSKSIMANKNLIVQSIGRTIPLLEIYREKPTGYEVRVCIAYNSKMAKAAAKKAAADELAKQGEEVQKKLDDILGW